MSHKANTPEEWMRTLARDFDNQWERPLLIGHIWAQAAIMFGKNITILYGFILLLPSKSHILIL